MSMLRKVGFGGLAVLVIAIAALALFVAGRSPRNDRDWNEDQRKGIVGGWRSAYPS
jgi:hypothetical protein